MQGWQQPTTLVWVIYKVIRKEAKKLKMDLMYNLQTSIQMTVIVMLPDGYLHMLVCYKSTLMKPVILEMNPYPASVFFLRL